MTMFQLDDLPVQVLEFLTERHLSTMTVRQSDGSPAVTPVGMTYEHETCTARVITWSSSFKARSVGAFPQQPVALCQVDGARWLTLYGTATLTADPDRVSLAVDRYRERYRPPKSRPDRVVVEVAVDRIVGQP